MTDLQLYLAIGIPVVLNSVVTITVSTLVYTVLNQRITDLRDDISRRFDAVNTRFDDMRTMWLAELHRVEGVLDARLSHLEERSR